MVVWDKASESFVELETSPALRALAGGSNDGRAVREREAWERMVVAAFASERSLPDNVLRITSLGTGTGEPAIDSGLAAMEDRGGKVEVYGVDVSPDSLRVAEHLAEGKTASAAPGSLEFTGINANLLAERDLARVVRETGASVYEAIGFAEYVPSEAPDNPAEARLRSVMEKRGLLSAEGFYRTIYSNMPEGSVLVSGNIRSDSPQGQFVTEGLGWPLILQRDTQRYLDILQGAGIPGEAVQLFTPGPESAGVYNLVMITKLASSVE